VAVQGDQRTNSLISWERAYKATLLPLIILQNKTVKTIKYNKTKTAVLHSRNKILKFQTFWNCQLSNLCTLFIMVDYLNTSITTFLTLHQSTNIKQGLLFSKNIVYPHWKRLWVSFLWSILIPKCGLTFLKIWNRSCVLPLENNIKTSCYLENIPVDFSFIYLSLFCDIVFNAPFSLISFSSAVTRRTPVYIGMLLPSIVCCCCFVYVSYLTLIPCILLLYFLYLWNVFN